MRRAPLGLSAVAFGATTTITGSLVLGRVAIVSWSWEQLQGTNVTLIDANTRTVTFRAPATGDFLLFELTATDSGGDQYTDRIRLSLGASVDQDGDGLIEIDSLTMLHNMRHNLAGTNTIKKVPVRLALPTAVLLPAAEAMS